MILALHPLPGKVHRRIWVTALNQIKNEDRVDRWAPFWADSQSAPTGDVLEWENLIVSAYNNIPPPSRKRVIKFQRLTLMG